MGGIDATLEKLADSLAKRQQVRSKVRRALTYPALSLGVALVAGLVLVTYALPALLNLLSQFGGEMPLATRILIDASELGEAYALHAGAALLFLAVAGWWYTRTERGAMARSKLALKTPVIGKIIMSSNAFALLSSFVTLVSAGIAPLESLRLSREGVSNRVLGNTLEQITKDASEGKSLGLAFRERGKFPPIIAQGMSTGEATGNLPSILRGLADYYEQEVEKGVSGATELIQPAVILLVAVTVGFIAVAVISGIYSTIGSVG